MRRAVSIVGSLVGGSALAACSMIAGTDELQGGGANAGAGGNAGNVAGSGNDGGTSGAAGAGTGGIGATGGTGGTSGSGGAGGTGGSPCGNGREDFNEQCDDGNTDDGDRCKNDCTINCPISASATSRSFLDARDGTCFVWVQRTVPYASVERDCAAIGPGFVGAKVEDDDRRRALASFLDSTTTNHVWLGLTQRSPQLDVAEGWEWIDGSALPPGWAVWAQNEPNDGNGPALEAGRENCVDLRRDYGWRAFDLPCSDSFSSVFCSRP
jgi:cysteine-rich repeat protein